MTARRTLPLDPWARAQVMAMDKLREENGLLLAALERLYHRTSHLPGDEYGDVLRDAKAAIKKARGR